MIAYPPRILDYSPVVCLPTFYFRKATANHFPTWIHTHLKYTYT